MILKDERKIAKVKGINIYRNIHWERVYGNKGLENTDVIRETIPLFFSLAPYSRGITYNRAVRLNFSNVSE